MHRKDLDLESGIEPRVVQIDAISLHVIDSSKTFKTPRDATIAVRLRCNQSTNRTDSSAFATHLVWKPAFEIPLADFVIDVILERTWHFMPDRIGSFSVNAAQLILVAQEGMCDRTYRSSQSDKYPSFELTISFSGIPTIPPQAESTRPPSQQTTITPDNCMESAVYHATTNADDLRSPVTPSVLQMSSIDSENGSQTVECSSCSSKADNLDKCSRRPIVLHPFSRWLLVTLLMVLCMTIVGLTSYSQSHNGLFTISPRQGIRQDVLRSIWSSGPTFLMTVINGWFFLPMALAIYLIAPYAELELGGAGAQVSIGANYAFCDGWARFVRVVRNRRWGLVCLTIGTFLAFWLDVAASGLIESRNVVITRDVPVQIIARLGLELSTDMTNATTDVGGDYIFLNSDQYLAAALYAGGQQLYRPSSTPFSHYNQNENWFVTPFNLSNPNLQSLVYGYGESVTANVTIRTYAVNTNANCKMADSITFSDNNYTTATVDKCSFTFPILGWPIPGVDETTYPFWHFANTTQCQNSSADFAFKTFVYASYRLSGYVTRDPAQFLVMFCQPSISIAKVDAQLAVSPQGDIGALIGSPTVIENYPKGSNSDNPDVTSLLGPPLNGLAVNGYDISEPAELSSNTSRKTRASLTRSILQEGIHGAILEHIGHDNSSDLSTDWYGNKTNRAHFGAIVSEFYQAYLNAFTPSIYFNTNTSATSGTASLSVPVARAWVSLLHAIGLGSLLFMLACLLAITYHQQHLPSPNSYVWRMCEGTMLVHMMTLSLHLAPLFEQIRSHSHMKAKHIVDKLKDVLFSINQRTGMFMVHSDVGVEDLEAGQEKELLSA